MDDKKADSTTGENQYEPTIESDDIQERLAARRLRIQRRLEAARRALSGGSHEVVEVEEMTRAHKQIEVSRQRLTKLIRDGNELVTNIRVACDAREQMRRSEDEESRRVRKEKLEAEAKAATERFDEITRKWDMALQKDIPQELQETLMLQKQACDAMIEEKNKLITDLQNELRNKDDVYVRDMKKHTEDIDLLVERMEEEVRQVWKAYREELNEIEKAYTEQRRETYEKYKDDWEKLAQFRRQKEIEYLELKLKRIEDNEAHLQQIRVQDAEEYNILKIKLETEVQQLEQQLQQMKATYQLNQEKLEYNFQVLKKRDEENAITKNQQKRKITKLHDILNLQRQKLTKQEKQFKDENAQLLAEYKRVIEQLLDLQRKSHHFLESDQQMFREVWCLNEEEAKKLANRLLDMDRILYEQQLGIDWDLPKKKSFDFLKNVGPIVSSKTVAGEKAMSAHDVMREAFENVKDGRSSLVQQLSADAVKRVLELLCDESGFLVETKLWTLLQPLDRTKQCLMRLDSVFQALGIETEEDIRKLTQYFIVNSGLETSEATDSSANSQHLVHPNEALRVLLQFINDNRHLTNKMTDDDLDLEELFIRPHEHVFHIAKTEDRDNSEDAMYWQQYGDILPEERVKIWNAVDEALESYHELLGSRTSLLKETGELQQQNTELKMLLHQYLNARVNKEMQVPPTRVFASTHIQQQQAAAAAAAAAASSNKPTGE